MARRADQIADALKVLIEAALPGATVGRNGEKPARLNDAGGNVILRDGDPGEAEVTLSPLAYSYNHRFALDVAAYESAASTREQALSVMLTALRAPVEADRTLGGLCEWIEFEAPVTDDGQVPGTEPFRWAEVGLVCAYTIPSPLA